MFDEEAITALLDKAAVSDLVRRYFISLDRFDWDAVAECIDDQYLLESDAPGVINQPVSRDEFMRSLRLRNGGFTQTIHMNPDHLVDIRGDAASLTSHGWFAHAIGAGPENLIWGFGIYSFDAVRRGGEWKLSRQRIDLIGGVGDAATVFRQAVERQQSGLGRG